MFKSSTFDIMRNGGILYERILEFLGTRSEWHAMPGYKALLCAFKCKPLPSAEEIGPDPTEWIGEKEKVYFYLINLKFVQFHKKMQFYEKVQFHKN